MDCRLCFGERRRLGRVRGGEGEDLEGLDAGDWDDMVVSALSLLSVARGRSGGGVDRDEVGDGARGEERSLYSGGCGSSSSDANATREQD